MTNWEDKVWGKTRELVSSPFYSKHELRVEPISYCSLHLHKHRCNRFRVQLGCIEIIKMYGPVIVRTLLAEGDIHDVPSLVPHMFVVHQPGIVFEEYYSDRGGVVQTDDIVRFFDGGKIDNIENMQKFPQYLFDAINHDKMSRLI